ncbi:hypothetical protein PHMEG_00028389 [Phytophthora megakarya]|uniref:Ankyrin repeat-containing domain n=1 Tax=Phytophthora megakarya TaxID=4795 RepID=A0A225V632_9STRA|nr:hypothetical protein PHMEG_00028389 [Phytophthora megakarya]
MEEAAAEGHLNVVKWLHANRQCFNFEFGVVRWLLENKLVTCPNKGMEEAAWRGHLDLAIFLGENTVQRASNWGLISAARQGYLRTIFVLTNNTYNGGRSLDWQGHKYIYNCISKVLNQLSDHHATPVSILSREILETIECFHACNFYSCVSLILNEALQQGFVFVPRQFFKDLAESVKRKYVAIAGEQRNILLMRWLLENGATLDILTAISLALENYVEITWWLSESDRVALVCQALKKKWFKVLLWVLENTVFKVYDSCNAIRDAIKDAPRETKKWLRDHCTKIL